MKTQSDSRRLSAGLTLVGAVLLFASCSVDTSGLTFIPDSEFNNPSSGGSAGSSSNVGGDDNGVGGDGAAGTGSGGDCTPDTVECTAEGVLRECLDGTPPAWNEIMDCGAFGQCSAMRRECLECVPGSFRCSGVALEQCDMTGKVWESVQDCIDEASCTATGQTGYCKVCDPNASACEAGVASVSDGEGEGLISQIYTCATNGAYTELAADCQANEPYCLVDSEGCGECFPGDMQCRGVELMICGADGFWTTDQICSTPSACDSNLGECNEGSIECNVGETQCTVDGFNAFQTCAPNGKWQTQVYCDTYEQCTTDWFKPGCDACVQTGQWECNGASIQMCVDQPGTSKPMVWNVEQCLSGCSSGQTQCNDCYPGQVLCQPGNNYFSICDADAVSHTTVNCGPNEFCVPGMDRCVSCYPNGFTCENEQLYQCYGDGSGKNLIQDCAAAGRACNAEVGRCLPANLGSYYCDDEGNYTYVDLNGNESIYQSCGVNNCDNYYGCYYGGSGSTCTEGTIGCRGREVTVCEGGRYEDINVTCSSSSVCQPGIGCTVPVQVGAGYAHTCAVLADENSTEGLGYAVCWGANEHGQLGNGSEILADSLTPRRVVLDIASEDEPPTGELPLSYFTFAFFKRVCGGRDFSCADFQSPDQPGQTFVVCWGSNEFGQHGTDNPDPGPFNAGVFPFGVNEGAPGSGDPVFLDMKNVTCGEQFACAIDNTGQAYCWGRNEAGQLGADVTDEFSPRAMAVAGNHSFVEISAGAKHACAVDDGGVVWCWGDGMAGQLGSDVDVAALPTEVGSLAVSGVGDAFPITGRDFSAVLVADANSPSSWGSNFFGQLADGTTDPRSEPGAMSSVVNADVTALFASSLSQHFCLRGPENTLSCAGANVFGQLGNGSSVDSLEPVSVWDGADGATTLGDLREPVAVGGRHTCAINADGELWCWGANHRHQLGSNKSTPQTSPQRVF